MSPAAVAVPPRRINTFRSRWLRFFSTRVHAFWAFLLILTSSRRSSRSAASRVRTAVMPIRLAARRRAAAPCPSADSSCLRNFLSRERATASSLALTAFSLRFFVFDCRNIAIPFLGGRPHLPPWARCETPPPRWAGLVLGTGRGRPRERRPSIDSSLPKDAKSQLNRAAGCKQIACLPQVCFRGGELYCLSATEPQLLELLPAPAQDLIIFTLWPERRRLGYGDASHSSHRTHESSETHRLP